MDELQLIRDFRTEVAPADKETLRAARGRLLAHIDSAPRARSWPRVAVVVAALVAAGALTASGMALYDFIAGEPPPPSVTRLIVEESTAERIGPMFAAPAIAQAAHGVAALETSRGRVLLWAAPTKGNAVCYFVEFERLSEQSGSPQGDANCGYRPPPTTPAPTVPVLFVLHRATIDRSELAILVGWTNESIESVSLRSPEGEAQELPLFENFFIAEIPSSRVPNDSQDGKPYELVATDLAGTELRSAGITEFSGSIWRSRGKVTGPKRTVIDSTDSRGRPMRLSLIPIEGGEMCVEHTTQNGTSGSCGPAPRVREGIQVHPVLIESMVYVSGSVGPEVAKLELHHQDGYVLQLPLVERFVFYDIPRDRFEDGRRPILLVARNRDGVEVAREKIGQRVFVEQTAAGRGDVVDPSPGRRGRP
jgi:hypothetical protein